MDLKKFRDKFSIPFCADRRWPLNKHQEENFLKETVSF